MSKNHPLRIVLMLSFVIFLIIGCAWLFFMITPGMSDYKACPWTMITNSCISQTAERVGVEPNVHAIADYINGALQPGMTRDEVHQVLEELSTIHISGTADFEIILLNICPSCTILNSLTVHAYFSEDGILIKGYIDET